MGRIDPNAPPPVAARPPKAGGPAATTGAADGAPPHPQATRARTHENDIATAVRKMNLPPAANDRDRVLGQAYFQTLPNPPATANNFTHMGQSALSLGQSAELIAGLSDSQIDAMAQGLPEGQRAAFAGQTRGARDAFRQAFTSGDVNSFARGVALSGGPLGTVLNCGKALRSAGIDPASSQAQNAIRNLQQLSCATKAHSQDENRRLVGSLTPIAAAGIGALGMRSLASQMVTPISETVQAGGQVIDFGQDVMAAETAAEDGVIAAATGEGDAVILSSAASEGLLAETGTAVTAGAVATGETSAAGPIALGIGAVVILGTGAAIAVRHFSSQADNPITY